MSLLRRTLREALENPVTTEALIAAEGFSGSRGAETLVFQSIFRRHLILASQHA